MGRSVSELASRAGITPDTVRYYGRLRLLPETGRTAAGHRYYDDTALERLRWTPLLRHRTSAGGSMTTMDLPRSLEQRTSDARSKLEARHADAWVASASSSGTPHLVPLSFAWNGAQLVVATEKTAVTTRNIIATARARVGLGSTRDVVMVDVVLDRDIPVGEAPDHLPEQYAHQADWDPRSAGGEFTFLLLRPVRIQVWRDANEIERRTVLRDGTWLI